MTQHARQMISNARSVVQEAADGKRALSTIAPVIALAVLREGAETVLFLYGIASQGETTVQVLTGGALGPSAGALVGAAFCKGPAAHPGTLVLHRHGCNGVLHRRRHGWADGVSHPGRHHPGHRQPDLGYLPVALRHSTLGTLLHVLAGYDARPSAMQALFYISALAIIVIGMRLARPQPARVGVA